MSDKTIAMPLMLIRTRCAANLYLVNQHLELLAVDLAVMQALPETDALCKIMAEIHTLAEKLAGIAQTAEPIPQPTATEAHDEETESCSLH